MPVLLALSRTQSLDKAADQLGVNRTTVTRQLKSLEIEIGGSLFANANGVLTPTELGIELVSAAQQAETHLIGVADGHEKADAGPIIITAAPNLMQIAAPVFLSIARSLPRCQIAIASSYQFDPVEFRKAEIALRILRAKPEFPLIGKKLKTLRGAVYSARKKSVKKFTRIVRPGEAKIPTDALPPQTIGEKISIDDIMGKRELIAAGGIGRLPLFMGDADKRLMRASKVLPDAGWQLWLLSHHSLSGSMRISNARAMIEKFFRTTEAI